jgi:hypothetical protein
MPGSVPRLAEWLIGLVWAVGVASLVADRGAAGTVASNLGVPHDLARLGVACVVAAEAFVGVGLLLQGGRCARISSAALLAVTTGYLVVAGFRGGWSASCGCLSVLWTDSVLGGIARNLVLLALHVVASRLTRCSVKRASNGEPWFRRHTMSGRAVVAGVLVVSVGAALLLLLRPSSRGAAPPDAAVPSPPPTLTAPAAPREPVAERPAPTAAERCTVPGVEAAAVTVPAPRAEGADAKPAQKMVADVLKNTMVTPEFTGRTFSDTVRGLCKELDVPVLFDDDVLDAEREREDTVQLVFHKSTSASKVLEILAGTRGYVVVADENAVRIRTKRD